MKKLILHILLLVIAPNFLAQKVVTFEELKPIYERIERYYNNNYALHTQMFSYKGHQNTVVEDKSFGFVIKKGTLIESHQLGVYSLQDTKVKVLIDSSELMVGLTYPDTTTSLSFDQYKQDYKLKLIEKITLQQNDKGSQIDFYYKKSYQYERVSLQISTVGLITEMTLYFANEIAYEAADGTTKKAKAKVKLLFKEMPSKEVKMKLRMQDIIVPASKGYVPTESFKKFEFIDFRYQN